MKKFVSLLVIILSGMTLFGPALSDAARVRVVRRGPGFHRAVVVVRPGHPIRRAMVHAVVVRPNVVVRVAPVRFLPLVLWAPVVIARPAADALVWQDAETLASDDDYAEVVFNSDQRGRKLDLEVVSGKVQFDFAEIVFENGDTQVVDFNNKTYKRGIYSLFDFRDGRKVDHVRLIARARTDDAEVALLMEK